MGGSPVAGEDYLCFCLKSRWRIRCILVLSSAVIARFPLVTPGARISGFNAISRRAGNCATKYSFPTHTLERRCMVIGSEWRWCTSMTRRRYACRMESAGGGNRLCHRGRLRQHVSLVHLTISSLVWAAGHRETAWEEARSACHVRTDSGGAPGTTRASPLQSDWDAR